MFQGASNLFQKFLECLGEFLHLDTAGTVEDVCFESAATTFKVGRALQDGLGSIGPVVVVVVASVVVPMIS